MTQQEMENALKELRDAQLVHVRLLDRHEREWNERMRELVGVVASHEQRLAGVEERLARQEERHEDGMLELRAAMERLFEHMDRFIQGLDRGNGKKG